MRLPLTINFDSGQIVGTVETFNLDIPHIHEYFIAPAYAKNEKTGKWDMIEYSLVHRSRLPTDGQMKLKEEGIL